MSQTQPIAQEPTEPAFHRAFSTLLNAGRDLLSRLQAALIHKDTTHLPRRFAANPLTAEQRVCRTLDWIVALARTLAGDRTWLIVPTYLFPRFKGRYPSLTADLREQIGLPPVPPRTEAQKAAAHLWYVRKVFATQPTAKIAARLARRLGIAASSDAWPSELLTLTHPPATYAKSKLPSPSPSPPSCGGPGWGAAPQAPLAPTTPNHPPTTTTGPP